MCKEIEAAAEQSAVGSVERRIKDVFLTRWSDMQSDIVCATYCLDPLFVDNSKQ